MFKQLVHEALKSYRNVLIYEVAWLTVMKFSSFTTLFLFELMNQTEVPALIACLADCVCFLFGGLTKHDSISYFVEFDRSLFCKHR